MRNYLLPSMLALSALTVQAKQKPNILWIITDDQRADALACWNKAQTGNAESALGYVHSPNIDALAAEGVLFVNAFCNSPVSAPSRASMHTGKYPHHNGIPDFRLTHNQNGFANPLVTDMMREAGYMTTLFGKLGVRICDTPEKLSFGTVSIYDQKVSMENDLERSGISDWCKKDIFTPGKASGTLEQIFYPDGEVTEYYKSRKNADLTEEDLLTRKAYDEKHFVIRDNKDSQILGGVSSMPTERTLDGYIAEEFVQYINHPNEHYKRLVGTPIEGPKTNQPQFINLGFHFPHTAVLPSKEYRDLFLSKSYNVPELTQEEYDNMPKQVKAWHSAAHINHLSPDQKEQVIRDYYAFTAMGDALLGKAVEEFKQYCADQGQEYVIVFACGDHGWHLGEQGVCRKGSGYIKSNENAIIVVSSDKKVFPAGKVVRDFVEYVDFYPTFMELAGFDTKSERFEYLDGRSLTFTSKGKMKGRDYVVGETSVGGGPRAWLRGEDFAFSMRIREDWRAPSDEVRPNKDIKWGLEAPREEVDMMLFDLRNDKGENHNVANDPAYAELADWFRNKLGNIVLGDGRVEVNWPKMNDYAISDFALGSDDKVLDIPKKLIPKNKKVNRL